MNITLTGAFPHSEELVQAQRDAARKRITEQQLTEKFSVDRQYLFDFQKTNGFTQIVDGMLDWGDLLRPFSNLGGVERGSLTRWFNNNTFYWAPNVTSDISWSDSVLKNNLNSPANKLIVPGPYTFSRLCENNHYKEKDDIMLDFSQALNRELKTSNADNIQISEPALVFYPPTSDSLERAKNAITTTLNGISAKTYLHTYFGSLNEIYPAVLDFDTDYIGVDFLQTDYKSLDSGFDKGIVCGIVNCRSSAIETVNSITDTLKGIEERLAPKELLVAPNADLDLRPRWVAEKKIESLLGALQTLEGVKA